MAHGWGHNACSPDMPQSHRRNTRNAHRKCSWNEWNYFIYTQRSVLETHVAPLLESPKPREMQELIATRPKSRPSTRDKQEPWKIIDMISWKLNKLRWYPKQPQNFIFTNPSERCCKAKRWKPCWTHWTWPGSTPKPPRPSPEPLRNLVGNSVERDLAPHQCFPDLLRNFRNLLRNLVEADLAPAPLLTGAILGWRNH